MAINKHDLDAMNEALGNGKTISQLAEEYPQYDYREIYWEVNDASFLGKKRTLTNRINKLINAKTKAERQEIAEEAKEILNDLYRSLKSNSKKLVDIDRILRK